MGLRFFNVPNGEGSWVEIKILDFQLIRESDCKNDLTPRE